ncbi:YusW family protein [Filibacter tadaridae]|uniref:YusW-like protein n=1 Tax=Filibacter tadaridae TaxID=2483811 RepID=A0A3P5WFI5_9BACL|nr:YusW family protein [Filibacter tadaridae]VDC19331.1 hypothetical protein FILTAD_00267 [Filibacter tadaridae]
MANLKAAAIIALSSALLMGGCGNFGKNANEDNREDADIIHENEKEGGSLETGDGYGFDQFDLEIDVDGNDAIDTEYDVTKKAEGEYENKLTNTKLKDNEAMDELDKLFMDILITKDTPEDEVVEKVLQYYGLETYTKFDLEVNFDDGTNLDIERVK